MSESSIQEKVGRRIKLIREEKNIPQVVLAAKCNLEKGNLSRLEAGRANATLSTLERVANALEVHISELFKD
jgi:transcriptional regulator with XRE-family HTH domain